MKTDKEGDNDDDESSRSRNVENMKFQRRVPSQEAEPSSVTKTKKQTERSQEKSQSKDK